MATHCMHWQCPIYIDFFFNVWSNAMESQLIGFAARATEQIHFFCNDNVYSDSEEHSKIKLRRDESDM